MGDVFPSNDALAARAGSNPWRLRQKLATGNPAEVAVLAKAFADASGDAQLAGQLAREASELTAQGYTNDGTPLHDPEKHVARTRRRLGCDGDTMRRIAVILDGVSDDLEKRIWHANHDIATLDGELRSIRAKWQANDRGGFFGIGGTSRDERVEDAVDRVRHFGRRIADSIRVYEQTLSIRLKSLSDLGYTPPEAVNTRPATSITVFNLNIGMGLNWRDPADRKGVEPPNISPEDLDRLARLIATNRADVVAMQEWHDVPGLRQQLQAALKRYTGHDWDLVPNLHYDATGQGAYVDKNTRYYAGTMIAVQRGDGIASTENLTPPNGGGPGGVQIRTDDGRTLNVYNVHGDSGSEENAQRQAAQVRQIARQSGTPSVIVGDFNLEGIGGDFEREGFADTGDGLGPTQDHGRRIDYGFTGSGARSNNTYQLDRNNPGDGRGSLTDHDGLVLDVEIPAR